MKGILFLGLCAMNLAGFTQGTSPTDPTQVGMHDSDKDVVSCDCSTAGKVVCEKGKTLEASGIPVKVPGESADGI
ncbi:MAG: hypothetical protein H6621_05685 [Halobacteriovoraceae bacterium]|nr:hypothetical protein [Halobacteriovoraceae bacterium]